MTRAGNPGSEHATVARPAGTVAFFTFLSRLFGLVRDVVVAYAFGAQAQADAFFVAFRIPNLLRSLVAEGALTASFLPVYVDYLVNREPEDAQRVVNITSTLLTIVLAGITIMGVLLSPWIVRIVAPGFGSIPGKLELAVALNRLLFPYIFFISLVALCMGILNARGRFAAPAASPVLLNVFMIAGALLFSQWFDPPVFGLALGVLLGGVSQLVLQFPAIRGLKIRIRPCFAFRDPAVRRIMLLFLPAAFGAAVYQLNVFISTVLASYLPEGSVSYLWYADRLMEFPLGVFGVALATAAFPSLSQQTSRKDFDRFRSLLDDTLRLATFVSIPAMVGLMVLRVPIMEVFFQRGAFHMGATNPTADALFFYCIGLWPIAVCRILVAGFYSLQDTRTPVKASMVAFVANLFFSLLLMGPLLHCGLALANSLAAIVNGSVLLYVFRKRVGGLGWNWVWDTGTRVLAASVVMGLSLLIMLYVLGWDHHAGVPHKSLRLALCIGAGTAVFVLVCSLLKVRELSTILRILRRRRDKT